MIIEEPFEVRTPDGVSDGYLYRPEDGRRPGVVHYTDIGGIRPAHRTMARRLAGTGYTVLMPNIFYRTGKAPFLEEMPKPLDEGTLKLFGEFRRPLTPEAVERDAAAYVDALTGLDAVAGGPVGVLGFCFAGSMALRTAAARPEKVGAAASFHGGGLWTDSGTSPHRVLPRVKARLYFGHADGDRSMPPEAIAEFEKALAAWGGRYRSELYPGDGHGWTVPDSAAYDPKGAEQAFGRLTELFVEALAGGK